MFVDCLKPLILLHFSLSSVRTLAPKGLKKHLFFQPLTYYFFTFTKINFTIVSSFSVYYISTVLTSNTHFQKSTEIASKIFSDFSYAL